MLYCNIYKGGGQQVKRDVRITIKGVQKDEENEEVINYLLENTNASIIPIKLEKDFNVSIGIDGAIRLYPFNFKGEGHFICLIKCNDEHDLHLKLGNKLASRKDLELYRNFEKSQGKFA